MNARQIAILLGHALLGWALCSATMSIGQATMRLQQALIVHAVAAPIFFTIISLVYFRKFHFTTPLQTALVFVGFVIAVDFFIVALTILRSLEMFASLLGTWIPFVLIFASTWVTGSYVLSRPEHQALAS